MKLKVTRLKRLVYGTAALAIGAVATLPALLGQASAAPYNIAPNRSIEMSSSAASSTNTQYNVGFTTGVTTNTIGSVVIDFCSNSPIIGDSCTAPTGFSINKASLAVNGSSTGITGLSVDTTNSTDTVNTTEHLVLTRTAGSITAGTAVTVVLGNTTTNGFTNPSTVGTFYARISTYTATDGSGTNLDAGGVPLATTQSITVTAKVQETLTFCVYQTSCGDSGAVPLGDANGVLSSTATNYTNTSKFDLASNATTGVTVRLKGDVLKSGSNSIPTSGATCTADVTTATTAQFGIRISTAGTGVTGAQTNKYGCNSGFHALDTSTACGSNLEGNVTCTYGEPIATTSGPQLATTPTTMEYMAKAATTTQAGIYTSTFNYIATGKY